MVQGPTLNNNQSFFYKKYKKVVFSPTGTFLSSMAESCKISLLTDIGGAKVLWASAINLALLCSKSCSLAAKERRKVDHFDA